MRVLVLRHHEEDLPGLVGEAFAARGATVDTHLYPGGGPGGILPELGGYDHLVILGSSFSVYAPERWIASEIDWLRDVPVPVFGICFGAQLLAASFGGAVERSPVYEIGWVTVEPVAGPAGNGREVTGGAAIAPGPWFQFHGDRCVLPEGAQVLARNEVCVQAFTVGRHFGVQFHPELDAGQLERWIEHGGRDDIVKVGKDPDELVAQTSKEEPAARSRAYDLVGAYLAHAGAASTA